jgi:succinate dehydrogenase / fumarate reductase flavoprotein subunit
VGIFRTEEDLRKGIAAVAALRNEARSVRVEGSRAFNPGWHLAHDLENMLQISESVARCALQRKESRGAHARLDYPGLDPQFGTVNSVVTLDGDEVRVAQSPLPQMPDELRSLFEPEPAGVKS